jgi:DNA-binding YbaB/EbfC family protein
MIFGNMGEMMKMAREMQGQMKKVKDELAKEIFEGASSGVKAKVSGDMELKDIKIDAKVVDPGKVENLEKQVKEALNQSLKAARDGAAKKLKGVTGGLGLPGMF